MFCLCFNLITQRNGGADRQNRTKPTLFRLAEFQVRCGCNAGKFFKSADVMALVGIAIVKGDVAEFAELAAIELLKSVVELGNTSEHAGGNADILFE